MNHLKHFGCLAAVILLLTGCNGCNKGKSREKPDVSAIKLQVQLLRFDQDLFALNTGDYEQYANAMRNKYGPFFDFYVSQFVIGPRPVGDTTKVDADALKKFLADPYVRSRQDSINLYFRNTNDIESELTQAFKYMKYYFPEVETPKVITINSGFSLGAFTYDKNILGVGLDMYLGANNPDYDSAGIYDYLRHKMNRTYIARNSLEALYNLYFDGGEPGQKDLIESMIDKGKKIYFLSYVFPDAPDSLLVGFTATQTEWCEKNEYEIWKFLNDKDMLYKMNYMDQKRYLDEGPNTPGMPPEAPGNIGGWIGLQIVRKFAKETGGTISLHDLVVKYNSKAILDKARYRPAKPVF